MIRIQLDSPVPLAEQIRLEIRQAIVRGALKKGDALPTVRQLANDLGVNFNTVSRAYRELERTGLVAAARGRGTVVLSDRETVRSTRRATEKRLLSGLGNLLADARLAGLPKDRIAKLLNERLTELI